MTTTYFHERDRSARWFIFEVMKKGSRGNLWVALLTDVDPEDCQTNPRVRPQQRWLDLGAHKSRDDAWDLAEQLIATRH